MNQIDAHMLVMSDEQSFEMLSQLRHEPVNVVVSPGIEGNSTEARRQAFCCGNAPWMTFVDPDDMLVAGVLHKVEEIITKMPEVSFVAVNEATHRVEYDDISYSSIFNVRNPLTLFHHLFVFKRSLYDPEMLPAEPMLGDMVHFAVQYMSKYPNGAYLDEIGYVYQVSKNGYANKSVGQMQVMNTQELQRMLVESLVTLQVFQTSDFHHNELVGAGFPFYFGAA